MDEFLIRRAAESLTRTSDTCPDDDLLAAALEGQVSPEERKAIEAHVVACKACSAVAADFNRLASAPVACPPVPRLLQALLAGDPDVRGHAFKCHGCSPYLAFVDEHPNDATDMANLLDAESRLHALGAAVSVAAVVAALLRRRASLSAQARSRVHRSTEGWLGTSTFRPRRLAWAPFDRSEDTYEVTLFTDMGEARLRTHEPSAEFDPETWARLAPQPDRPYRWRVTALRGGRALQSQEGTACFLTDEEQTALGRYEASARELPADRAMLVLATLYRDWKLLWDACNVLLAFQQRHPGSAVAPLLLAEVFEEMGRAQEASRAVGLANRLLVPA